MLKIIYVEVLPAGLVASAKCPTCRLALCRPLGGHIIGVHLKGLSGVLFASNLFNLNRNWCLWQRSFEKKKSHCQPFGNLVCVGLAPTAQVGATMCMVGIGRLVGVPDGAGDP